MGGENAPTDTKTTAHHGFLDLCNENRDGVLSQIVIGDETWIRHYESESKQDYVVS